MIATTGLGAPPRQVRRRMVELACLAPSFHNTQPWRWRLPGNEIWLYADQDRRLDIEDALGRNLMISCGAALHHVQLAARALGWSAEVERLPEPADSALLAKVHLVREPCPDAAGLLDAMRGRCTDRRRFTSWPVPDERLEALADEARNWDVTALPVLDLASKFRLELTIGRALDLHEQDHVAREEQDRWTGRVGDDGIPLPVVPEAPARDARLSRFGGGLLRDNRVEVEASDGLLVLGGEADHALSWLRTGEALSALWLRASHTGLSVVPLSQPIEIPATRLELRELLGGTIEPHLLVRIGWQAIGRSELPRTPRRPVDSVLLA